MTFGYESGLAFSKSGSGIDTFALDLLNRLRAVRADPKLMLPSPDSGAQADSYDSAKAGHSCLLPIALVESSSKTYEHIKKVKGEGIANSPRPSFSHIKIRIITEISSTRLKVSSS